MGNLSVSPGGHWLTAAVSIALVKCFALYVAAPTAPAPMSLAACRILHETLMTQAAKPAKSSTLLGHVASEDLATVWQWLTVVALCCPWLAAFSATAYSALMALRDTGPLTATCSMYTLLRTSEMHAGYE